MAWGTFQSDFAPRSASHAGRLGRGPREVAKAGSRGAAARGSASAWGGAGGACSTRHLAPQPPRRKRDAIDLLDTLTRGRESSRRQAWAAAYQLLARADQATPLGVEDLDSPAAPSGTRTGAGWSLTRPGSCSPSWERHRTSPGSTRSAHAPRQSASRGQRRASCRYSAWSHRQNQQGHRHRAVRERENDRPARE
jgi:hypothetical protein